MNTKAIKLTESDKERFWSKVDIKSPEECWEWKAGKTLNGYGTFRLSVKHKYAHRLAWELTNGPIPEGMSILHKCDNRGCCNPDHLYVGTQYDNMMDRAERNPNNPGGRKAKLYEGEIWLIRKLRVEKPKSGKYRKYKFHASYVAKMFKVSQSTIYNVWNSDKLLCREGYYV
jgi:hypothetical protein